MQKKYTFPYDPYEIQTQFMDSLYDSLLNCKGGLLESPTGTGKTMSIICASITFLYDKYKFLVQDFTVTPDPKKKICLPPSSALPHIFSLKRNLPPGVGVKIVYLSRTHSQLDQFTNEVKKTEWGKNNLVSFVRLASRSQLCVNPEVNKDKLTINYNCNQMTKKKNDFEKKELKEKDEVKKPHCPFYENSVELKNEIIWKVCDIEDLVQIGKRMKGCPYYGTKLALEEADVIIAPYYSVINRKVRNLLELDLSKCHVIIDEAHNIVQTIIDCYSTEISEPQILNCLKCLSDYKDKYKTKMEEKKLKKINLSLTILTKLKNFVLENERKPNISIQKQIFFTSLEIRDEDLINLSIYFEENDIPHKAFKIETKSPEESKESLFALIVFQEFMSKVMEINGEILFIKDVDNIYTIKFVITDPYEKFQEMLGESLSIVLTSGTLSPPQEFLKLFETIPSSKLKNFSCGHIIPPEQLFLTTIGRSPQNVDMKFVLGNRDNSILFEELGEVLYELCCFVPNGIIVFVPSFSFLESLKKKVSESIFDKIGEKKRVFFDNRNKKILKEYSEAAEGNGAILFAVVRGSLSEGINFSDKLGRCVVVVGLPYLNMSDPEVKLKMKYYDQMKGYSGYKFYDNACDVAINQAIGRAIRHERDYAAIVLIDSRHVTKISRRPKWMHPSIRTNLNYSRTISALQDFYRLQLK